MKTTINYILFILIAISSFSCSHQYYAPNAPIMLKISDKNELKVSAAAPGAFQVGYSPINKLAIAGSFFTAHQTTSSNSFVQREGKGHLGGGALGFYHFFEKTKARNSEEQVNDASALAPIGVLVDIYGGYSQGKIENSFSSGGSSQFDIQQYYLQAGFHFKSNYFDAGLVFRQSILNYYNGLLLGEIDPFEEARSQLILDNNPFNNSEISLHAAAGVNYLKAFWNLNLFVSNTNRQVLQSNPIDLNIGIIVELNEVLSLRKGSKKGSKRPKK